MLKKHMAACLVATLFAAPAFAQSSGSPAPSGASDRPTATGSGSTMSGSPAMQPGTANPSSGPSMNSSSSMSSSSNSAPGSSTMAQSGSANGQFMIQMQPGQMMASELIGTKVVSANNESIGDINDVVVDRNGQAVAAVVGVGGFLGIGEKTVAVPFKSLEFASRKQANAMSNNGSNTAMNNSANNVSTTGSTANKNVNATGSTNTNTGTSSTSSNNEPDHVILNMTKAELQAAPKFDKNQGSSTATGTAQPKQ